MTLTGTVDRVHERGTFAFIQVTPNEEYFAHYKEFESPDLMKPGQKVTFFPAPTHQGPQAFKIQAAVIPSSTDLKKVS